MLAQERPVNIEPRIALRGATADNLLVRSFHGYSAYLLAPQGGGYRHYLDLLWPYGGLGIAHAMLRLGMLAERLLPLAAQAGLVGDVAPLGQRERQR